MIVKSEKQHVYTLLSLCFIVSAVLFLSYCYFEYKKEKQERETAIKLLYTEFNMLPTERMSLVDVEITNKIILENNIYDHLTWNESELQNMVIHYENKDKNVVSMDIRGMLKVENNLDYPYMEFKRISEYKQKELEKKRIYSSDIYNPVVYIPKNYRLGGFILD